MAVGSNRTAYAALVSHTALARKMPDGPDLVARLQHLDVNGVPTVLEVLAVKMSRSCTPAWFRVQLSVVPNGTTAWVPAHSVRVFRVASRIVVDLSKRQLDLYRSGRHTFHARVAIGAPGTRTPTGRFFVNERFVLTDPNGPFGVAALGISAHSTTLQDWAQGGPIALHGTNDPASIGGAVSHGCVRLANDDMRRLLALAPAGTPVLIKA